LLTVWGALVLVYFQEALSRPVLLGERDLSSFFFPAVKLWVETLRQGEFPFWNPYSFTGQPLFASLQAGVLYPPNVLLFILPPVFGFNLTIALHFFFSGWFVYLLIRELAGSPEAGILAALSFALGGFLLSLHSVLSSLQTAAWAPLILFFLLRSVQRASKGYALLTWAAVLIQFLGGGIEIFLVTQVLVGVVALYPRLLLLTDDYPPWPWRLKLVIVLYLLFLGAGAIQLFPFWEMVRESSRGQGFSFEQATRWSLAPTDLWNLVFPDFFWRGMRYYYEDQNWLKSIYLGVIPLSLLFFYLVYGDRRRPWWAGLLLGGLILALGKNTPVYALLYGILPGVSLIRYPVKFFFLANLILCLMAGLGWDALVRKVRTQEGGGGWRGMKLTSLFLSLTLAVLLLTAVLFRQTLAETLSTLFPALPGPSWDRNLHNFLRLTAIALLTTIALTFLALRKLPLDWGGRVLIFLLLADLFLGNRGQYRLLDREAYFKTSPNLDIVKQDRELSRVYTHPQVLQALVPAAERGPMTADFHQERFYLDYPLVQQVYNASGFQALVFNPIRDLLVLLETSPRPEATDVLRLLNVKYLLWPEPIASPDFRLIRRMGPHYTPAPEISPGPSRAYRAFEPLLYEIRHTLPRAVLIPEVRVTTGERELGNLIKSRGFNPAREVLVEAAPVFPEKSSAVAPPRDEIRWLAYRNSFLMLEAACAGPRMLLLNEPDYPGWQVRVDGRPEKIYRANHAFRAVPLGPGVHTVRFDYRPGTFYWGYRISLLTWLVVIGAAFRIMVSRRPLPARGRG